MVSCVPKVYRCEVRRVIVYGEYLFIENMITGMLLLYLTAKLTGCQMKKWRFIIGGIFSGVCGFSIFLSMHVFMAFILRGLMTIALTAITLGTERLVKKTALFLILTFLSGGATMAFFTWQQIPSLAGNGVMYMGVVTYIKLICFGTLGMGFGYWFIRLVKNQRRVDMVQGKVCLEVEGKQYSLRAYVDSGNSLREPLTGKPVILIDEKGKDMLGFSKTDFPDRFTVVPYQDVYKRQVMIYLGGKAATPEEGCEMAKSALHNGKGLEKLCQFISTLCGNKLT